MFTISGLIPPLAIQATDCLEVTCLRRRWLCIPPTLTGFLYPFVPNPKSSESDGSKPAIVELMKGFEQNAEELHLLQRRVLKELDRDARAQRRRTQMDDSHRSSIASMRGSQRTKKRETRNLGVGVWGLRFKRSRVQGTMKRETPPKRMTLIHAFQHDCDMRKAEYMVPPPLPLKLGLGRHPFLSVYMISPLINTGTQRTPVTVILPTKAQLVVTTSFVPEKQRSLVHAGITFDIYRLHLTFSLPSWTSALPYAVYIASMAIRFEATLDGASGIAVDSEGVPHSYPYELVLPCDLYLSSGFSLTRCGYYDLSTTRLHWIRTERVERPGAMRSHTFTVEYGCRGGTNTKPSIRPVLDSTVAADALFVSYLTL